MSSFALNAQTYKGKQKEIDKILKNVKEFSEFFMAFQGKKVF